jgi:hypothetical protein
MSVSDDGMAGKLMGTKQLGGGAGCGEARGSQYVNWWTL